MDTKDKVIFNNNLGVSVGNFNIESDLLKNNISPFLVNNINHEGSSFKTIFNDLAIPTSLYILESLPNKSTIVVNDTDEVIDDKVYDRLLSLLSNNKQINHNRYSRKKRHKETKSKKSRKNK